MTNDEIDLHDKVLGEIDRRKLQKLVDDGVIPELHEIPIHSVSDCCCGHLVGNGPDPANPLYFTCSICKKRCESAEEL